MKFPRVLPGLLVLAATGAQADVTLPFETAVVESAQAPLERIYDGTVEAVHQATMSAQTSGRIADVFFDVDDYVEAGEVIVRFTDTEQQSALRGAEAALAEALARQTQAGEDYRRIAGLLESGTASKRDYDQALASRDAADARVTAARSSVNTAKQQLEYTLVRAPYAGIVTERHVEVGEAVSVGQPLMSGLSLESLRIVVHLPQQVAAKVRKFGSAAILTDEGRVRFRQVRVGNNFGERIEVLAGLEEGEHIALDPVRAGIYVKSMVAKQDDGRARIIRPSRRTFSV